MNDALDKVKDRVGDASEKTVTYIKALNESKDLSKVPVPRIEPMTICMHELQNALQIYNEKH